MCKNSFALVCKLQAGERHKQKISLLKKSISSSKPYQDRAASWLMFEFPLFIYFFSGLNREGTPFGSGQVVPSAKLQFLALLC